VDLRRWSYGYTVLLLCWFGWISIYLCRSALPPVLPILVEELGITHAQAGMFGTAYLMGYILIKIPAGLMARKIGIKRALILGMVGYGFATMLNLVAASFVHLLVLRFLVGLFQGIHLPLANTLLSERFGSRQGRIIGFHESGPNVGNAIALPLAVAIASSWGWRRAFFLLSLPAFALAAATALLLRGDEGGADPSHPVEMNPGGGLGLRSFGRFLVPLALAHAVYNLCLRTLFNFAPIYLVEFRGLSLATAGFISMILPAAGFFAKISSGFVAEKLGRRNAICAAAALSGVFIMSLTHFRGAYELSLVFMLIGLVLYSFSPTIYASVTAALPFHLRSVGLGVVTMTGSIVGALSTFAVGFLIDAEGYNAALLAVSATVLVATALIYTTMGKEPPHSRGTLREEGLE